MREVLRCSSLLAGAVGVAGMVTSDDSLDSAEDEGNGRVCRVNVLPAVCIMPLSIGNCKSAMTNDNAVQSGASKCILVDNSGVIHI